MSTSIDTMDRAALKRIDEALTAAVEMVAEDLGLEVEIRGGRFDREVGTFTPKVTFSVSGAEAREYALVAPMFGLDADTYGREFTSRGQTFKVVGLNPRASRFPVVAERGDGKRFKFTEAALAQIKAQVAA